MARTNLLRPSVVLALTLALTLAVVPARGSKTSVGKLEFVGGFPTRKTLDRLYGALDLQRAVQAYLWALPLAGFAQWKNQHEEVFGARNGEVVYYAGFRDKLGILTANSATPYAVAFYDLERNGPLLIDYPAGPTAGAVLDSWLRIVTPMGSPGPDQGKGGRYLVLGPGQSADGDGDWVVVRSETNNIIHGLRLLSDDEDEAASTGRAYQAYPYAMRESPPPTRVISPDGREWSGAQPQGIAYWKLVATALDDEPVRDADRLSHTILEPLGIENGKPFEPDERQRGILDEAAWIGEAMARSLTYARRGKEPVAFPGTRWVNPRVEVATLDQRVARYYEAVLQDSGQAYVSAYRDKSGRWLQGGSDYELRVPADPPAGRFWSLTVYDAETRCFIETEHEVPGVDSRMDLVRGEDGTVVIYFGPDEPEDPDRRKNWIPTLPRRGWFAYFRIYGPAENFPDENWKLPDIRRVETDDELFGGGG